MSNFGVSKEFLRSSLKLLWFSVPRGEGILSCTNVISQKMDIHHGSYQLALTVVDLWNVGVFDELNEN